MKWLRKILGLCEHEWKLLREITSKDDPCMWKQYQCEKCLKSKTVYWGYFS